MPVLDACHFMKDIRFVRKDEIQDNLVSTFLLCYRLALVGGPLSMNRFKTR